MLEEIRNRVQKKLDQNHSILITAAFDKYKQKHFSDSCPCTYCQLTRRYRDLKIHEYRLLKRVEDYYSLYGSPVLYQMYNEVHAVQSKIALVKAEREQMRSK